MRRTNVDYDALPVSTQAARVKFEDVPMPDRTRVIAHQVGDVCIDLAETTFVDTCAVRIPAGTARLLEQSGRHLSLRSPSTTASKVLRMFAIDHLIEVHEPPSPRKFSHPAGRRRAPWPAGAPSGAPSGAPAGAPSAAGGPRPDPTTPTPATAGPEKGRTCSDSTS
jgi:ABC-type transporter Mla MlaB component